MKHASKALVGIFLSLVVNSRAQVSNPNPPTSGEKKEVESDQGTTTYDKSEIAARIKGHLGKIKRCYDRNLIKKPGLKGRILTNFVIGLEGKVTEVRIKENTSNYSPLEKCLKAEIKKIEFPKPGKKRVEVFYPFKFGVESE